MQTLKRYAVQDQRYDIKMHLWLLEADYSEDDVTRDRNDYKDDGKILATAKQCNV